MKCFYHSADLDGHCSGELVLRAYPQCEMYGINYGDVFPWDKIKPDDCVFMVDFSLQPFSDMIRLFKMLGDNLIWIDHHKSAIENWESSGKPDIRGIRRIGRAGCELTHDWLHPNSEINMAVAMLGRYDVWDLRPGVLEYQYGVRSLGDTQPGSKAWKQILDGPTGYLQTLGETILGYIKSYNEKYLNGFGFKTTIDGHDSVAVNIGMGSSQIFDSLKDTPMVMIAFVWKPDINKFMVSLYSKTIDVSVIAKNYGGGGHTGAAGFQCEVLPFNLTAGLQLNF